nr:PAS domain-containing sensor histidine kinase [Clostridia bacterium]
MTKKIFRSTFLVAALALLSSLVVILGVVYGYFVSRQKAQLASLTALAARGVAQEGASYFDGLDTRGVRL